jgi:hypothetical protein
MIVGKIHNRNKTEMRRVRRRSQQRMDEQDIDQDSRTHTSTLFGSTAANGEPVMCAISLSAQRPLKTMEISGYNATGQLDDEEPIEWENIEDKFKDGTNKKFPFWAKVYLQGKCG